jgi:hypothetical protein
VKVQRREAADVLTRDGETAVLLTKGGLVRLSAISAAVYALTQEPVDVDDLARHLEVRFGTPAGQTTLDATKDAVTDLIRHGVLRVSAT